MTIQDPLPFRNLKELKNGRGVNLSPLDWRNCFADNPGIENLEYWDRGRNNCLPLLKMLPELKRLMISDLVLNPDEMNYLSSLTNVTKFSFSSKKTYSLLLVELAEKLNLVDLEFSMPCNADTFAIIKSFLQLEYLSIRGGDVSVVPDNTIFPSMLKHITLDGFHISCSIFLSAVKQLEFLEEFDIGSGIIFWDNDRRKFFYQHCYWCSHVTLFFSPLPDQYFPTRPYRLDDDSKIISRIAENLRVEKRKLKILFSDDKLEDNLVVSNLLDPMT